MCTGVFEVYGLVYEGDESTAISYSSVLSQCGVIGEYRCILVSAEFCFLDYGNVDVVLF